MRGALSDCHLGGGGPADDGDDRAVQWAMRELLRHEDLEAIVVCGDLLELWQFRLGACLAAHRELFAWLDDQLSARGVLLHWVQGNHDGSTDVDRVRHALREVMPRTMVVSHADHVRLGGWLFLHGHQFDRWNKRGPLQPLAHGLTWIAGLLERAIPGFDENKANPRNWFSPARATRESFRAAIRAMAAEYADAYGDRLVYGHTHRAGIAESRRLVNVGCCLTGRASCAALWDDGHVVLHEMR